MSIRGRWRVVETPGYDMAVAGAYILFDEDGGEFAFDCLIGSVHGSCDGDAVQFGWQGNDEMEPVGPNCRMTARSKVKSASSTATTSHSSHVDQRLLQQPAKSMKLDFVVWQLAIRLSYEPLRVWIPHSDFGRPRQTSRTHIFIR
jgi:hypothetical protein